MTDHREFAQATARILIEIEAVLFRPDDPFVFTSGRASPVYVDCRKIISFPRARARLMDMAVEQLAATVGSEAARRRASPSPPGFPNGSAYP